MNILNLDPENDRNCKLGQQKNKLGDIVSEFARKAMAIAREKFDQEQMANRLKTQVDITRSISSSLKASMDL